MCHWSLTPFQYYSPWCVVRIDRWRTQLLVYFSKVVHCAILWQLKLRKQLSKRGCSTQSRLCPAMCRQWRRQTGQWAVGTQVERQRQSVTCREGGPHLWKVGWCWCLASTRNIIHQIPRFEFHFSGVAHILCLSEVPPPTGQAQWGVCERKSVEIEFLKEALPVAIIGMNTSSNSLLSPSSLFPIEGVGLWTSEPRTVHVCI